MKKITTILLFVFLAFRLIAAETLTFRFSNPHIEYYAPDNYLVFDVLVKASANATYLYASQVICNINLANFNTAIPPTIEKGFIDGTYDPPGPSPAQDKYSVYANYNSGNLNLAALANVNLNNYLVAGHSEITTEWQTLCKVYCAVSNTAGVAGITFQLSAMNGYQKFATNVAPLYSAYYANPNQYEGDNFTDLYLNRIFSGGSGWTQAGGIVNWSSSVNTSVWDTLAAAAVAGTSALADNLRIHNEGRLIVNPGSTLTVAGTLINNANAGNNGLLLKSDALGTASLLHSTAGVPAIVQRYIAKYNLVEDYMFHFLSSPVAQQPIRPEFVTNTPTVGHDFYAFSEPTNIWINTKASNGSWNTNFENNFITGKAYLMAYPVDVTKNFTGILNVYPAATPLVLTCTNTPGQGNGWNLLGNPFPSSIDWNLISLGDGMDNALYYYNSTTQNYIYYIALPEASGCYLGTGTNFISPEQGFMVHAKSTGTKTVTISDNARTHEGNNTFYKSSANVPESFSLTVSRNGFEDVAFIHFNGSATSGFDGSYDAYKLRSNREQVPVLYTKGSDGAELAINGLPELTESTEIPVYFETASSGTYRLTANLKSMKHAQVYLQDIKENTLHNLSLNPEYSFTASAGEQASRFVLRFESVGINQPVAVAGVNVYANGNKIFVSLEQNINADIRITNTSGQLVMSGNTDGRLLSIFNADSLADGEYIVAVVSGGQVANHRVIITH